MRPPAERNFRPCLGTEEEGWVGVDAEAGYVVARRPGWAPSPLGDERDAERRARQRAVLARLLGSPAWARAFSLSGAFVGFAPALELACVDELGELDDRLDGTHRLSKPHARALRRARVRALRGRLRASPSGLCLRASGFGRPGWPKPGKTINWALLSAVHATHAMHAMRATHAMRALRATRASRAVRAETCTSRIYVSP